MKGFLYEQDTGTLSVRNGDFACPLFVGSAGRGDARNDPAREHERSIGPLPSGEYRMRVVPHSRFAAPAIALTQTKGETYSRSGFYIHGGTQSEGCILIQKRERDAIAALMAAGFDTLRVVP